MADNSGAAGDSTLLENNLGKSASRKYSAKKTYLEPKFKTAGYVDGECYPY